MLITYDSSPKQFFYSELILNEEKVGHVFGKIISKIFPVFFLLSEILVPETSPIKFTANFKNNFCYIPKKFNSLLNAITLKLILNFVVILLLVRD